MTFFPLPCDISHSEQHFCKVEQKQALIIQMQMMKRTINIQSLVTEFGGVIIQMKDKRQFNPKQNEEYVRPCLSVWEVHLLNFITESIAEACHCH